MNRLTAREEVNRLLDLLVADGTELEYLLEVDRHERADHLRIMKLTEARRLNRERYR
jgi:hypothetical protein